MENIKEKILALAIVVVLYLFVAFAVNTLNPVNPAHFVDPENVTMRTNLIALLVLGIVGMILGAFFINVESIGAGIMGGSLLITIHGAFWFYILSKSDYERLALLGVTLIVLVYIGYKKFGLKKQRKI